MKCYHHNDLDGHCAGAIVLDAYPSCEMIEVDYNQTWDSLPHPDLGETVYVVDFSFPVEVMAALQRDYKLTWIDHHKTAIEAMQQAGLRLYGIQDTGRSGAALTWAHLHTPITGTAPEAVRLVSLYDLGKFQEHPNALYFNLGCRCQDTRPQTKKDINEPGWWDALLHPEDPLLTAGGHNEVIGWLIEAGKTIHQYHLNTFDQTLKRSAVPLEFVGHQALAINGDFPSYLFNVALADRPDVDLFVQYAKKAPGQWTVGLYSSRPELDCGALARTLGGGGHPGSAGFVCEQLPFEV